MNRLDFFVGRQSELDELASALEDALSGRLSIALVVGEPGIGKTRLVREFASDAADRSIAVSMGTCVEGHEAPSYWPWRGVVSQFAATRFRPIFPARVTTDGGQSTLPELYGHSLETHPNEQPSALFDRWALLGTVAEGLSAEAAAHGLLVILENLQWADPDSVTLLESLAQQAPSSRIMILVTSRDSDLTLDHPLTRALGELVKLTTFRRIHLRGLSAEETTCYIEHVVGWPRCDLVAERVHDRAEGNPLFMVEMARDLLAHGPEASLSGVSAGIRDFVGRRLARLPRACVDALSVASVIGRRFDSSLLVRVIDEGETNRMARILSLGERAGFTEKTEGPMWQFTHALVQEALYDDLPAARREELHARIADAMQTDHRSATHPSRADLLRHLFAGLGRPTATESDVERIVQLTKTEAEAALDECAPERALKVLNRTLDLVDINGRFPAETRKLADLLHLHGRALHEAGQAEGQESLVRAFDLYVSSGEPKNAIRVALTRTHHRCRLFSFEVAVSLGPVQDLCTKALALVEPNSHDEGRLLSAGSRQDGLDRALLIARQEQDDELETWTLARLAEVHAYRGEFETSISLWRRVLHRAQTWKDRTALNWFLYMYTFPLAVSGDVAAAGNECLKLVENAESARSPRLQWRAHYASAAVAGMAGEWDDCREHSQRVFSLVWAKTTTFSEMFSLLNLGLVEFETGNHDAGSELLSEFATSTSAHDGDGFPSASVKVARITDNAVRLHELAGRLRRTTEPVREGPFGFSRAAWHVARALVAALTADQEMAASERPYFRQWSRCYSPIGMSGRSYDAIRGLIEGTLGDLDAAVGHLHEAVGFCRASGLRPELAWSCLDLAEALLRRDGDGDSQAALRILDEGEAVAESLRMTPLLGKLETCRNRIAEPFAWESVISRREAEVLHLVAGGLKNREIGDRLCISERTVASHMRNILDKLDASNRAEATAWALSHDIEASQPPRPRP